MAVAFGYADLGELLRDANPTLDPAVMQAVVEGLRERLGGRRLSGPG